MTTSLVNATGIPVGISPTLVNSTSTLLNPFTPLAFLPPEAARQLTIFVYVLVGTASVLVWDILCHLKDDYCLLTQHRKTLPMVVYFVARLFNLLYVIGFLVGNSTPIRNCRVFMLVVQSLFAIAIPATELIFLLHVRAAYINNRPAVRLFMFLWFCIIATSIMPVFSVQYTHIGTTHYCISSRLTPLYDTASAIVPLVNDCVLFGALAIEMLRSSYQERTFKGDIKAMVFGHHIPIFSRALLHNGQAYFLSTVFINLAQVTLYFVKPLPTAYREILSFPNILLMITMSSRLYRNTKLRSCNLSATLPTLTVTSSSIVYRDPAVSSANTMTVSEVHVGATQTLFKEMQSEADDRGTLKSTDDSRFDLEALC